MQQETCDFYVITITRKCLWFLVEWEDSNTELQKSVTTDSMTWINYFDLDSSRGSPFQLLLNQFRKAVGVLCIRNVVEEKLRRIMYIRPTKEGAKAAANTSNRRNNARTRHGPSWYNNFRNNKKLLMLSMRSAPSMMTTTVTTDLEWTKENSN